MNIQIKEMSELDIEYLLLEEKKQALLLGFKDIEDYYDFKAHAAEGLIRFGGGFAQPLGYALAHADSTNSFKIITNWNDECVEHAELHKKFIANRNKNQE